MTDKTLKAELARLAEIDAKLAETAHLYSEREEILRGLVPELVDRFGPLSLTESIRTQFPGRENYELLPAWLQKTGRFEPQVWKSSPVSVFVVRAIATAPAKRKRK